MRNISILSRDTPNPDVLRFETEPEMIILPDSYKTPLEIKNRNDAKISPLAQSIFKIPEVTSIMIGEHFVSVSKRPSTSWSYLTPLITESLELVLEGDSPFVYKNETEIPTDPNDARPDDSETVVLIKELLRTRVRPRVAQDGGDILFDSFDEPTGRLYVRLTGACDGCPSSDVTLKQGVERMMEHYIPEVKYVLNIDDAEMSIEELEEQKARERDDMEFIHKKNKELDEIIAEEKAKMLKERAGKI